MNPDLIEAEALEIIANASEEILAPYAGECLVCYVFRQIRQFGCHGTHRFSAHYRTERAPRATALFERLARKGACCCDCEMFLNTYCLQTHLATVEGVWLEYRYHLPVETLDIRPVPPCARVRAGSTQPCANWRDAQRMWVRRR